MTNQLNCRICSNLDGNKYHVVSEMMYGTKDKFNYIECNKCGCLQIESPPEDMFKYYQSDYYSFQFTLDLKNRIKLIMRSFLIGRRLSKNKFIKKIFSSYQIYPFIDFLYGNGYLTHDAKILDIGCGSGSLLLQLKYLGFKFLKGIDPFIDIDIDYNNGVSVDKKYIHDVDETYDAIILNHSFEHMEFPGKVLSDINRILTPNGHAIIRIPVASFAWKHYGVNWVQLDAPRHLYLHTVESMRLLSIKNGLQIVNVNFDSSEFQFCGSDQYVAGIPLIDKNSYWFGKSNMFTKQQINDYKLKAAQLNTQDQGDQACFVLKKQSF